MQVLQFIRDFREEHGYSPTMQEIGDHMNLTKVTIFEHVAALERKGLLLRGAKYSARSLRVCPEFHFPDEKAPKVPLVGRIAAGRPLEAVEDREALDLDALFKRPGEVFALRVTGNSMIDEQIRDGDYVICEKRSDPRNGETVVALLESGEATLKKFYRERNRIRLQPANPEFEPVYVLNAEVQGVVIGVLRRI
jgi:repressor LexA